MTTDDICKSIYDDYSEEEVRKLPPSIQMAWDFCAKEEEIAKSILGEFITLKTDKEKWQWVIENQGRGILVNCDNDDTFITIEGSEDYAPFRDYIGWSDGVFDLLAAVGINAESV